MNSRAIKLAVSLLLTVSLLCCSVSVFADDPEPSPSIPPLDEGAFEIQEELLSRYIWICLNAWGIQIQYNEMDEFYDEVEGQIITWVIEYLAGLPSSYTINQWIAPWQAGFDYWGNLKLNSNALEDIQDFAEWLKTKLGISDNDTVVINPVKQVGEYQLYDFNTFYQGTYRYPLEYDHGTYYNYIAQELSSNSSGFLGWIQVEIQDGSATYYMVYVIGELNAGTGRTEKVMMKNDYSEYMAAAVNYGSPWGTAGSYIRYMYQPYMAQYMSGADYPNGRNDFIISGNHMRGTRSEIEAYLNSANVREVGNIRVLTRIITMPIDNPDYSIGDGMTIIDGQPSYEVITFSGEITNLPAIVSTGTIENPEVDQIYTNIPAFFQMASDTMNGFKQIIFRMPDEVLISIYAVLAVGVIFGFLRIMREH